MEVDSASAGGIATVFMTRAALSEAGYALRVAASACGEKPQGDCRNGDAQGKHRCAYRNVSGRNVRCFVTPDDPGAQRDLTGEQQEPERLTIATAA